jgi:glycosyltransferase involved in cell wall biosynthesis
MPKVSVIVPIYNVYAYLERCLVSLVNQTLTDIEIIVVNDGSPDDSQTIIDTYAKNYPKIIKAYKKENGGLSDARNFGIKRATGEFIGFVDSDDFVEITMFEKLYEKAIQTESDIVLCAHNVVTLTPKNNIKKASPRILQNNQYYGKSIFESPEILAFSRSYAWNKLYKREILQGFEFPKGQFFEDSAVVYNILSAAHKIELVNEPLYNYVIGREGAITQTIDYRVFDIFKSCESIVKHYKKIEKFDALKNELESLCLLHIHTRLAALTQKGSLALKMEFVDMAFNFLEKHFPDWRNNKYYLDRLEKKLRSRRTRSYCVARESRKKLKMYYLSRHIKRYFGKRLKKVKKALKIRKNL